MKIKYILTFIIASTVFIFALLNKYQPTDKTQRANNNKVLVVQPVVIDKQTTKVVKKIKLDNHLLHIAQMISPPSNDELKDTWREEYTCEDSHDCNKSIFNANSYEDALWLKRKGYPSRSMTELLQDISKRDLSDLSKNGNVNAANLLAINALRNKDIKRAKRYARSSFANASPRETFGYRLYAQASLLDNSPIVATLYLRMASILGDTNANATYERITAGTASSAIDAHNRTAYGYLLNRLNTDINNLNNDPRPGFEGGG